MRLDVVALGIVLLTLLLGGVAQADGGEPRWRCRPGEWRGARASLLSTHPASIDLYDGMLWSLSAATVALATEPPDDPRWDHVNDFDDSARSDLRLSGRSSRKAAAGASHGLWALAMGAPLLADGLVTWSAGHCDQAFGIASQWVESMGLAALLVTTTKVASARERPGSDDRESFFSGHATLSATGAGLLCRDSIRGRIWGSGTLDRALPCGLGVAVAVTTGLLRVAADKHWMSDVLVAWGVGGLIGWFDLPGPFELLRFTVRGADGGTRAVGLVAPFTQDDAVGARLSMQFR